MSLMDSRLARHARRSRTLRPLGIAFYRTIDRLTPAPPGPKVVANSMPKSGTHLLTQVLDQIDGMRFNGQLVMYTPPQAGIAKDVRKLDRRVDRLRPSHYISSHLIHDGRVADILNQHEARLITILRDPRSVVLSAKDYLYEATRMPHRAELLAMLPDERAVLEYLVRGHGEVGDRFFVPEIGEHYRSYAKWIRSSVGLVVRFEDLVGPKGGGSQEKQFETVQRILQHLAQPADERTVARVAARTFSSNSITFHSGRVDSWGHRLPTDLAEDIVARCADDMVLLGYS